MVSRITDMQHYSIFLRIGLVESNIRKLVNDLERNEYILIAHVNVDSIELDPAEEGQR